MELGKVPMSKMITAVKNFGAALTGASKSISEFKAVIGRRKKWVPADPSPRRRKARNRPHRTMAKRRAGHHARRARK